MCVGLLIFVIMTFINTCHAMGWGDYMGFIECGDTVSGSVAADEAPYYSVVWDGSYPGVTFTSCGSDFDTTMGFFRYTSDENAPHVVQNSGIYWTSWTFDEICPNDNDCSNACPSGETFTISGLGVYSYPHTYTVWINALAELGYGTYEIFMDCNPVKTYKGDIRCGESVSGSVGTYEQAYYTFNWTRSDNYEGVTLSNCNSEFDTSMGLFELTDDTSAPLRIEHLGKIWKDITSVSVCPDANNCGEVCSNNGRESFSIRYLPADTYSIWIQGWNTSFYGNYEILMDCIQPTASPTQVPSTFAPTLAPTSPTLTPTSWRESFDLLGTINCNETVAGSFENVDSHWYELNVDYPSKPKSYVLYFDDCGSQLDTEIEVYDAGASGISKTFSTSCSDYVSDCSGDRRCISPLYTYSWMIPYYIEIYSLEGNGSYSVDVICEKPHRIFTTGVDDTDTNSLSYVHCIFILCYLLMFL